MSKRNWFAATALGLVVATAALAQSNPEGAGQQQEAAPRSQQDAAPELGYADRLLTAIERIEPAIRELIAEEDKIAAEEDRRRDQSDLKAQESMAQWAFWMFIASAASVVLTFIGLALIGRTLHHTRRAADYAADMVSEAKATTEAAKQTVTVTRDVGVAQTKAYLTVQNVAVEFIRQTVGTPIVGITFVYRNTGNSPARKVTARYILEVFAANDLRSRLDDNLGFGYSKKSSSWTLYPDVGGQSEEHRVLMFEELDTEALARFEGTNFITFAFWIKLAFIDVFGTEDTSSMSFKVLADTYINLGSKYELRSAASLTDRFRDGG